MKQLRVGFLGYGTRALTALMEDERFDVRYFFAPRKRLCKDVEDAYKAYHNQLEFAIVDDNKDLVKLLSDVHDVDCFVMNACPIILNQEVLDRMPVFNIHPGDLSYNRGHHPHLWTVLLGESSSEIVMHQVNCKIDDGKVLKSVKVDISPDDNAGDVLNKLEDEIPKLLDALYSWRAKGREEVEKEISNGGYRRKMEYKDYEIDVWNDDFAQMKRKMLARSMHSGAFVLQNDTRYYVDRIESIIPDMVTERSLLIDEKNQKVLIQTGKEQIRFHLGRVDGIHKGETLCGKK